MVQGMAELKIGFPILEALDLMFVASFFHHAASFLVF